MVIVTPKKGLVSQSGVKTSTVLKAENHAGGNRVVHQSKITKMISLRTENKTKLISGIKKEISFDAIRQLEIGLNVTQQEVAQILDISARTLRRRRNEGRLRVTESERLVRFTLLKDLALALMLGNSEAAISWLKTPLEALAGETPLRHASTELGAIEVEGLIGRLRHGVFN